MKGRNNSNTVQASFSSMWSSPFPSLSAESKKKLGCKHELLRQDNWQYIQVMDIVDDVGCLEAESLQIQGVSGLALKSNPNFI